MPPVRRRFTAAPAGYVDTLTNDGRILLSPAASLGCWGLPRADAEGIPVVSRASQSVIGAVTLVQLHGTALHATGYLQADLAEAQLIVEAAGTPEGCPVLLDLGLAEKADVCHYIPADRHDAPEHPMISVWYRWKVRAFCVDPWGVAAWPGCVLRLDPGEE